MITEDKILVQQVKIRKKKKRPAKNRQKLNFHLSVESIGKCNITKKRLKKLSFLGGGKNPPHFFVLPVDTILFVKFSALNLSALLQDVDTDIFLSPFVALRF